MELAFCCGEGSLLEASYLWEVRGGRGFMAFL